MKNICIKYKSFPVVITFVLLFFMVPVSANASIGKVVSDATIGGFLDRVDRSVDSWIKSAGSEARATIMEASKQMRLITAQLRIAYADVLDKTFSEISKERRMIFENSWESVEKLDVVVQNRVGDVKSIAQLGAAVIKDLPLGDKTPRVLSVAPAYVTKSQATLGAVITIEGLLLSEGDPQIELNGVTLKRLKNIDSELVFEVPKKLSFQSNISVVKGVLTLRDKHSWWDNLLSKVFNKEPAVRNYDIPLFLVPDQLGTVKVTWTKQAPSREEITVRCPASGQFRSRSPKWEGSAVRRHRCSIPPGFTPDTGSLRVGTAHIKSCQDVNGRVSHVDFGYDVKCNAYGKSTWADGYRHHSKRGEHTGHATIVAFKTNTRNVSETLSPKVVQWGEDEPFKGPSNVIGFSVAMEKLDGTRVVVNRGGYSDPWFRVAYNDVTKQLVIRPNSVDVALNRN